MRTLHLIESAHARDRATGIHSFLSLSAHAAIVLGALYATTHRPGVPEMAPAPRVYFTPEAQSARAASAAQKPKAAAPKPAPPKTATEAPATLPVADAPSADPSQYAGEIGTGERTDPYGVGEVEVAASALSSRGPDYPARAIRLAITGSVTARFVVDARGRVEGDVVILDSTSPDFTKAVRDFLRRARYRPARVGGQPVRQLVEQRFVFELRN